MIRVLVVDDHAVVRAGLARLLEKVDDLEVVGLVTNGRDAIEQARLTQADVVLLDVRMPDVDGIAACQAITRENPGTAVVMLTSFGEHETVVGAVRAGAVGYLLKEAEPDEIIRGLRAAANGLSPMSPRAVVSLLSAEPDDAGPGLTPRERDVLIRASRGMTNREIGEDLGIAEKTVKSHMTGLLKRIGASDRLEAALWAQRHGLLDEPAYDK